MRQSRNASSLAERQGEPLTSCPGAMRRQKRAGIGDGKWVGHTHTHTHIHSSYKDNYSCEWDGKLALAQDKAPSRGEPGEPRGFYTDQRTPNPKLGGTNKYTNSKDPHRRNNFTRGIRIKETKETIINNRNKSRNEHRKAYRRH